MSVDENEFDKKWRDWKIGENKQSVYFNGAFYCNDFHYWSYSISSSYFNVKWGITMSYQKKMAKLYMKLFIVFIVFCVFLIVNMVWGIVNYYKDSGFDSERDVYLNQECQVCNDRFSEDKCGYFKLSEQWVYKHCNLTDYCLFYGCLEEYCNVNGG